MKLQGYAEPRFARVADAFAQGFERHGEVGAACCVYLGGRPVVDLWAGLADAASARPWERDTLVITFSSTKGVTAVCANRLIEQGRLNPDAPVARYWPEFAAEGKGAITLRQVLGHRAGLAEVEGEFTLDDLVAWEPITRQLARQKPQWEPGTRHGYHMRSYGWLVGEVVRRVTGLSLGRYFAREIAAPLGLDFHIGLPESLEPRVATLYPPAPGADLGALVAGAASAAAARAARVMSGPSNLFAYDARWNTRPFRAPELPSSNGIGSARALARMYAACVGEVDGVRLLSDAAVTRACEVQSDGPDCVLGIPLKFGLGFTLAPALAPDVGPRAFGHPGAGGSLGFADPEPQLGFGYVMNQMRFDAAGDPRATGLVRALRASLG